MNILSINILLEIHSTFSKLPVQFRELVSEECNWSTPTFYRKMRAKDKPDVHNKGRIIPALSNAERQEIMRQARIAIQEINSFMDKIQ
ncbi:hypothetical protein [Chitinophaga polysaccharea]|uniref:hypothetical protein n=1 Tax=Chitinophaga polysaccharea TaxID=1293035 RepID=UPI001B3B1E19|nr:hypothetical protein [Chitinophaga polysaccharea]